MKRGHFWPLEAGKQKKIFLVSQNKFFLHFVASRGQKGPFIKHKKMILKRFFVFDVKRSYLAFGGQKNGKRKGFWVHGIRFYSFLNTKNTKFEKKIEFHVKRSFSVSGRPKNAKSLIPWTGKMVYFAVQASSSQKLPLHKKTQKISFRGPGI